MNGSGLRHSRFAWIPPVAVVLFLSCGLVTVLAEDYTFDLKEIEQHESSRFEWGGYAEALWDHADFRQDSSFHRLAYYRDSETSLDRGSATVQLEGLYKQGIFSARGIVRGVGQITDRDFSELDLDVYEASLTARPSPWLSLDAGKIADKWGKGYAWNPVGFINRPKNPNDPEEGLEGFFRLGGDLVKSFSGDLQTLSFTAALLPVWRDFNDDFGERNHLNVAAKLYLLYLDTDIDLMVLAGGSRPTRYGIDFSRNLATHFEIHGELAYIPEAELQRLTSGFAVETETRPAFDYLLGLRYLTENDITTILEYYHRDSGIREEDMHRFHQLVEMADLQWQTSGKSTLYRKAGQISEKGYARPQPGQNYLYARVSQKEPFDILYFTPAVTAICNVDDGSFSVAPELVYTGFTNWELRLRYMHLFGDPRTEYGEKLNRSLVSLRVRFFFDSASL